MNAYTKEKYDTETKNFKTLKYNISDNTDILLNHSCDQMLISSIKNFKVLTRHT